MLKLIAFKSKDKNFYAVNIFQYIVCHFAFTILIIPCVELKLLLHLRRKENDYLTSDTNGCQFST